MSDGTLLRVVSRGPASGDVIVLVHGWKQSHRLFDQAVHRLSATNRVIAFDQRGMGESDKPDLPYDFETLALDLHSILQWARVDSAVVVGWSMGCTTALSALAQNPDPISGVMLMNGPLRLTKAEGFPWALDHEELSQFVEGMEDAWPMDQHEFLRASLLPQNEGCLALMEQVALQTPLYTSLALVREQARIDHRETVANSPVPILAAYSRHDPYWPIEIADWIAETAPKGSKHVFTNSAHCPPLEEPEAFCQVVLTFASRCQASPQKLGGRGES